MALVTINDLTIRFRGPALLDGISTVIEPGQRIGLLGRNGAGKSTFLKLLAGLVEPDHGSISIDPGHKIAMLPQEVPKDLQGSVHSVVLGAALKANKHTDMSDHQDGTEIPWEIEHSVDQILSRMGLDPLAEVSTFSSGMKRRVLLAAALVDDPDLLLLDEPTNHLDINAINWLEEFLSRWPRAYMFITHDRQFLRRLANRILEIEGGRLFDWTCDYETFLARKEDAIAAQEKQDALFDKKLAIEETWIRQGIKARRTRNEGRVRALKELRRIRGERRSKVGTTNLKIEDSQRSGNLVLQATEISFAREGLRSIVENFSTTIMRGEKVGIIGPNGAGKTTLLRLLLGDLQPDSGSVKLGTNLQVAYFDQLRAQLDESKTVEEDVADGYQTIKLGNSERHVLGYLQDFLFTPERARTPIKQLSGGERNRVLLAKLFAKPANLIVLDEPTNDLDAETLEMLEARLVESAATMLIVSHDREFLNNVVTSTIVFEATSAAGQTPTASVEYAVNEYDGGYDDWLRLRTAAKAKKSGPTASATPAISPADAFDKPAAAKPAAMRRKLSFKETKELSELPGRIEKLEVELEQTHARMGDPDFYKQPGEEIAKATELVKRLDEQLARAYARWEELEAANAPSA